MIRVCVEVVNSRGMHARPSAKVAKLAARFECAVTVGCGRRRANAKSVASLLMLAAAVGSELEIVADGADENAAAAALVELVAGGFADDAVPNNPVAAGGDAAAGGAEGATGRGEADDRRACKVSGVGIGGAVVRGRVYLYTSGEMDVPRYRIGRGEVEKEVRRYARAVGRVRREFEALRRGGEAEVAEARPFIELHLLLLADEEFAARPPALIGRRLINAEWALKESVAAVEEKFRRMKEAYLRERYRDIEQLMKRLLEAMKGGRRRAPAGDELVVFAADVDPADVLRIKQAGYRGFVTETGGGNSHTAILARGLGIPALVGARGALAGARPNAPVLLDAREGVVIVNPASDDVRRHRRRARTPAAGRARRRRAEAAVRTRDGEEVTLYANIELPEEIAAVTRAGADGVGLFRSEFLFLHRAELPGEDEQFEVYRHVLAHVSPLPVVIRTLDLGGDKMPAAVDAPPVGRNPVLGLRSIRYCLAAPDVFMTQLRALLRAGEEYQNLRLLLPMLTHPAELDKTVTLIAAAREQLRAARGLDARVPPLGAMIEVPAAVYVMRALARQLSFFSIGSNDLIQYTMAADRNHDALAELCHPLHPAILQMLAQIVRQAARCGLPVTLCGELAGEAALTPLVLGLGVRRLSMAPAGLEAVREQIGRCHAGELREFARAVLEEEDPAVVREMVERREGG